MAEGLLLPTEPQYAGVQGDHRACEVVFTLPTAWVEADYAVRAEFVDGAGAFDTSDFLPRTENTVTVTLPLAWTAAGGLAEIRLAAARPAATGLPEEQVAYSPVGYLYFDSRTGEPTAWRTFPNRGLSALIADARAAAALAEGTAARVQQQLEEGAFDGSAWLFGTAVTGEGEENHASVESARVGDMYLNTQTDAVYIQTAPDVWRWIGSLRGQTGPRGPQGVPGGMVLPRGVCAGNGVGSNTVSPAVESLTDGLTVVQTFTDTVPSVNGVRLYQLASGGRVPVIARFRDEGEPELAAGTYLLRFDAATHHMVVLGRLDESAGVRDDALTVPLLIAQYGTTRALRMFTAANAARDDLTHICTRFFAAAAAAEDGVYTSVFPRYARDTPSTNGQKAGANASLTCVPSTRAAAETDDYAELPLFACFDVNYTIDAQTLEPVIHAVKGVHGDFSAAPTASLVGVMQMSGWVRRTMTDTAKQVDYRATEAAEFQPLPEAVRVDGTVRSFVIHAKYAAGYNAEGKLSSVSGVQPATERPGSAGSTAISHDGQIAKWRTWGTQYGGSGLCDLAFVQLMLEIKYAVLGSAQVMQGCRSYFHFYKVALGESGVKRVLLAPSDADYFVVGSSVSLGTTGERHRAEAYSVCDIVPVTRVERVVVNGTTYGALYLDAPAPFTTTTDTCVTAQPWRTGSTDAVQGNDGSPNSNTSGKEPCKIQGIEVMVGTHEVLGDTVLYSDADRYTVYLQRRAAENTQGITGADAVAVGVVAKDKNAGWDYVAELNAAANDQEGYMLPQETGATAATAYRAAAYREGTTTAGWREWMAFGGLDYEGLSGFACAYLDFTPSGALWNIGARACGSGGNRGIYAHAE